MAARLQLRSGIGESEWTRRGAIAGKQQQRRDQPGGVRHLLHGQLVCHGMMPTKGVQTACLCQKLGVCGTDTGALECRLLSQLVKRPGSPYHHNAIGQLYNREPLVLVTAWSRQKLRRGAWIGSDVLSGRCIVHRFCGSAMTLRWL